MVKTKRGTCSYHLCNKKKAPLYKCKYCGEYFCKEHKEAKPPGAPKFSPRNAGERAFMEEWRKEGGHPCIPYLENFERRVEKENEEYNAALNRVLGSGKTKRRPELEEKTGFDIIAFMIDVLLLLMIFVASVVVYNNMNTTNQSLILLAIFAILAIERCYRIFIRLKTR